MFPSTTWEHKYVKVKRRPQGTEQPRAKRGTFKGLTTLRRTDKVSLTIKYRGGSESWWLVSARGRHVAFPGWLCLEDVMTVVLNEPWQS